MVCVLTTRQYFLFSIFALSFSANCSYILQRICTYRSWLSIDQPKESRKDFLQAMGPHITEMKQVRNELAKMGNFIMDRNKEKIRPDALLAEAMKMEKERANPRKQSDRRVKVEGFESVSRLNGPIADFLYQSDILLDMEQTKEMWDDLLAESRSKENETEITTTEKSITGKVIEVKETDKKSFILEFIPIGQALSLLGLGPSPTIESQNVERGKRQAQTGRNFPRNQWDPSIPIPYVFDPRLGEDAKRVIRAAVRFWTENTCLSFAENGPGYPRVRFFPGGGCYSQVGKAFQQAEQLISIGKGCEQFGIAAHEIGHTLGFFHGQARSDRDGYVNVVYSNLTPRMASQFAKQPPENNYNYGIKYDYGSIMHYSDTDSTTNRITMHTMGNNVAPSFLDVMEMNIYYKCRDNCLGALVRCKHGGYAHPRDCTRCICPWGFGGFDCGDLAPPENGPSPFCGGSILHASNEIKSLDGGVSAKSDYGIAERHASCFWHIRAPEGKRVELKLKTLAGACADGCFYGGTELKVNDFARIGARICCRSDIGNLGILYSDTEMAIIAVFSQYKRQSFSLEYRAVDRSEVPPEGRRDFPPTPGNGKIYTHHKNSSNEASSEESSRETTKKKKGGEGTTVVVIESVCKDVATNCWSLLNLCDDHNYRELMGQQCAKTCMRCDDGKGSPPKTGGVCPNDHKNCASWEQNGFCSSPHYTAKIKREICPRTCKLC